MVTLSARGLLAKSGAFGLVTAGGRVLLISDGQRAGRLLDMPQRTGQPRSKD